MNRIVIASAILATILLLGGAALWELYDPATKSDEKAALRYAPDTASNESGWQEVSDPRAADATASVLKLKTDAQIRNGSHDSKEIAKFTRAKKAMAMPDKEQRESLATGDFMSIANSRHSDNELATLNLAGIGDSSNSISGARDLGIVFGASPNINQLSTTDQTHVYEQWAPEVFQDSLPGQLSGWTRTSSKLVSLNRFGKTRIFESEGLPTIGQLATASISTRKPTLNEFRAVEQIKKGELMVVNLNANPPILMTTVKIERSCKQCHDAALGTTIGVLNHQLSRKPVVQTAKSADQDSSSRK